MAVTGLLLAGGLSRRMGRDKATLVVGGQPMWSRQILLMRALGAEPILISARDFPSWTPPDAKVLLDTPPSRGPLSGLAAGLAECQTSHLLALAIDLPDITVEHLRKLLSMAEPYSGVVPRQDYFEPLCAIYPQAAAAYAQVALSGKDLSLQTFVRELIANKLVKEYVLEDGERAAYLNLNTTQDLAG